MSDVDTIKDLKPTLKKYFGYETFRPQQQEVIENVINGQDGMVIITNQLDWTVRTIADLYKKRWDIELFFKAIKQNL